MSEICLECLNKHLAEKNKQLREKDVIMDFDLCEDCGEWKPCVITIKRKNRLRRLKSIFKM
ncbi:MAG: hypothetical protein ACI4DP_04390 [Candidatus Ornithomonoglobus sp.]